MVSRGPGDGGVTVGVRWGDGGVTVYGMRHVRVRRVRWGDGAEFVHAS